MSFKKAERESLPALISLSGLSGSGKTYSALLLAGGLAGKDGCVGLIDTESGRGTMYADDSLIKQNLPNGEYFVKQLSSPFSPKKYIDAIKEAINNGITVLIIDSMTHEWEGIGGCQDIAEKNKLRGAPNWALAKMEHKKLMNVITNSPIHIILCLRARYKSVPMKDEKGRMTYIEMGVTPVQERNFMYEMTASFDMDEEKSGYASLKKMPKELLDSFGKQPFLMTSEVGKKIDSWANNGIDIDKETRSFMSDCRQIAMEGSEKLNEFLGSLTKVQKNIIKTNIDNEFKEEMRTLALEADAIENDIEQAEEDELY